MTDWSGKLVIRGFAEEIMRPPAARCGRRPGARGLGLAGCRVGRALVAAHRRLPRHRHLVADRGPGAAQARVAGNRAGAEGAPGVPLLGRAAADGGRQGARRHLREQGGPPGGARQGGGRRHRRRRPVRARRRRLRVRHRGRRHPPLHEHRLAAGRRRHGPLDRVQGRAARSSSRSSWRAAARSCAPSSGRSSPGATTSRCSWARASPAFRRSTSTTRPKSRSARTA